MEAYEFQSPCDLAPHDCLGEHATQEQLHNEFHQFYDIYMQVFSIEEEVKIELSAQEGML